MSQAYSVAIPAFNAEATIRDAIASILGQTVAPDAIYVVDDGSADGTAEAAAAMSPLVHVMRKANGGPGSATTAGLRLAVAMSPVVATLDADDLWLPNKMERQLAYLEGHPEVDAVFALGRLFRDGEPADASGAGEVTRLWTRTTMVFRATAARETGDLLDFPGYLGELVDWLSRSRDLGHRHILIEEVLAMRRVRSGSLSDAGNSGRTRGYLHAVRRALERRKSGGTGISPGGGA